MKQSLQEFGLMQKVSGATVDGGKNFHLSLNNINIPIIHCFAHALNVAARTIMDKEELSVAARFEYFQFNIFRQLVGHFNRSPKATKALRAICQQKNLEHHRLIQGVVTRWNADYDMFVRLLEMHDGITEYMRRNVKTQHLQLSQQQWNEMQLFVDLLKPFKEVTTEVEGDRYVTLSMIAPTLNTLMYEDLKSKDQDTEHIKSLKTILINKLRDTSQRNTTHFIASFLDPRYDFLIIKTTDGKSWLGLKIMLLKSKFISIY